MTSAWLTAIQQMYPDYDELAGNTGLEIEILRERRGMYRVTLVDNTGNLDTVVEWATETLASWPSCNRTAWNIWMFHNQRDAKKFKTICALRWL